ncbi:DNA-entry nuclease [Paenibacillus sp. FSL R5-0475]|uniref:DNA-entry nuclease n=1 Tax=Paenibacillus sp. FSL R5-0475 TaxID=2921643 RepID=UPI0030F604C0
MMYGDLMPHPESDAIDGITYDGSNRMNYHPEFHFAHGKRFSQEDLEYLCTFYESDNARSLSFALGKTEHVCRNKYSSLKKAGLIEFYKKSYERHFNANRA